MSLCPQIKGVPTGETFSLKLKTLVDDIVYICLCFDFVKCVHSKKSPVFKRVLFFFFQKFYRHIFLSNS